MNIPHELQDELQSYITEKLKKNLEEMFKDKTIEAKTYLFTEQEANKVSLSISIFIGTKFYEISEAVTEALASYCAKEELTDEECEKAYENAYKEELEEINKEHSIPIEGKIVMKLDDDSEAEIELYQLECDNDYCIAGLGVNIYVSQIPINWLEQTKDSMIDSITRFIESIYDLYATL
jgi:hypothetical protein